MSYADPPGYTTPRICLFGGGQCGKSFLARKLARKVIAERQAHKIHTQLILLDSNDDWRLARVDGRATNPRQLAEAAADLGADATIVYTETVEPPDPRMVRLFDRFYLMEEAHNYYMKGQGGPGQPSEFFLLMYLQGSSHRCNPLMTITHRPQEVPKVALTSATDILMFPIKERNAIDHLAADVGIDRAELSPSRFQSVMVGGEPHKNAKLPLKYTNADGLLPYPWIEP